MRDSQCTEDYIHSYQREQIQKMQALLERVITFDIQSSIYVGRGIYSTNWHNLMMEIKTLLKERKSRLKIKGIIREARRLAERHRFTMDNTDIIVSDRLLDDLADIAEKYLEGLK